MNVSCPFCAEEIDKAAIKCKHCGEFLGDEAPPKSSNTAAIVIGLAVVIGGMCLCVPIIAAIAIPNLIGARKAGNEVGAIGALKTIGTAQSLFREADKDGNGVLDYGNLNSLGGSMLIDSVLASGNKQGYVFQVRVSPTDPEFLWMAVASPAVPQTTGDRFFATNHEGVIFYSAKSPILLNDACEMPQNRPDVAPVGR